MEVKSYQSQVESSLKEYILADPFVPYTSIVGSIFACTMVYDLAQLISVLFTLNVILVSPKYSGSSGVTGPYQPSMTFLLQLCLCTLCFGRILELLGKNQVFKVFIKPFEDRSHIIYKNSYYRNRTLKIRLDFFR
ncbi:uncharacterized protein LOC127901809 [Citrus sinensis]|uniref:uncharacterized protein LOC127901809 n=1 Tax=Citrus sinensis TaxID=2711 RepID=UPI002278B3E5|nr:uncharacterized protein LOC127901809 [Citrus sinensis]